MIRRIAIEQAERERGRGRSLRSRDAGERALPVHARAPGLDEHRPHVVVGEAEHDAAVVGVYGIALAEDRVLHAGILEEAVGERIEPGFRRPPLQARLAHLPTNLTCIVKCRK